ncbi:MAG: PAS domain S-box protein, partial [Proteobacteria bacterium]|nr:PAS domain S-box protein [Pseudomonadota bacterium]
MVERPSYEALKGRVEALEAELERYRAEAEGVESGGAKMDFRGLAERSQDAIYHYDLVERKFRFTNRLFVGLFGREGRDSRQLTTEDVAGSIHPEDRAMVRKTMIASLAPDRSEGDVEYRVTDPGGSIRWMHDRWVVIRDDFGRPRTVEGFIRDTTALKMADVTLEASKRNALIGSYIVQDGLFRYVNPEFNRITQYTVDELRRMSPLDLVHEDYKEYVREKAVKMLKGERSSPYEFSVVNKDGGIRWIMETVTSIRYGGSRAALGYFMDITRLRDMQHNLSSLGLMLGITSHSLRNCLTGLDAALYLIDSGFYQDKAARIEEGLDTAKLMIDRLRKLVFHVLYY